VRAMRHMLARLIAWLIGVAAVLAVAVTAFVYSGQEHREAVTSVAREFFVFVERGSRVRRAPVSALASPTPEGGVIQ
jgi:hypothetical protein